MEDLYCPTCHLVLYGRAVIAIAPEHCPRCAARDNERVRLLPRPLAATAPPRPDEPRGRPLEIFSAVEV